MHLANKSRSHSFKLDLVLHDWLKQGDHKLSPIFKGPFVIVRPVAAVCYEIRSTIPRNRVLKVVHDQHLRPYFKRDTPIIEEDDCSKEESKSAVVGSADDLEDNPDGAGLLSRRYSLDLDNNSLNKIFKRFNLKFPDFLNFALSGAENIRFTFVFNVIISIFIEIVKQQLSVIIRIREFWICLRSHKIVIYC
ncbi:hypothetical protein NPIL_534191 [Nephila pilipes]|uniref:Uncharacterized protein n=1 Tax=Nephila pilipes TaxID=299642 RepID=A0A8X6PAD3_NEPPI|nr:hypothetical protein NPIL_534191 [Nephila pilipes]